MNKSQLVDALADRLGDRKAAATAVDALLQIVVDTVRSGDSVSLAGFGVFESRARAARTGRNPRTGETVAVPATTVPAFRPGTGFRNAVAGDDGRGARRAGRGRGARRGPAASSALLARGGDERFGRRRGAQRRRRPDVGAHHDAPGRAARGRGRRQAGQGEEARGEEGGREAGTEGRGQAAAAKSSAKSAKSAPKTETKVDAKKGKKGKKGERRRLRGAQLPGRWR